MPCDGQLTPLNSKASVIMNALTPNDLYSLEKYAKIRKDFRAQVMEHKKTRQVPVGPNATLYFEDRLTIQYQVQEMLRIERIFEPDGIEEELAAYNPLVPDGGNWKATFMIEYADAGERQKALERLIGIENRVWVQVQGHDHVSAIADEDLERQDDTKTSAVHFLRFELTPAMVDAVKNGASISLGIDHPEYQFTVTDIGPSVRESLAQDLGRTS
jgi:hypothetical protein